ncbi:expressed unknown protein [Seminavis robusta]|uniref:Uncharacterized protein n=1 Tax=Seminavis robusta TaxID=568900 RepID=A0A9N8DKM0_9STRA|nr:expressed unknown protein [Seminavis robusta]|eukprot:Sro132_g062650.1 n/a (366) ;mRNA; r:66416-67513
MTALVQKARLVAAILLGGAALASSLSISTEPPEIALAFCRNCNTNVDCDGYAKESTCAQGQCTNDEGLLGRDCICDDDSECSTGRCDGIFQSICRLKLKDGETCNKDSHCISGVCADDMVCFDPSAPTVAPKVRPLTSDPRPLPIATASPKTEACVTCAHTAQCGEGVCNKGICTDASGELPIYCGSCMEHEDCVGGYFCASKGLMGRTGKLCERKKRNGAACFDNSVCRSDHCNMLFSCESKIPEHKRTKTATTADKIAGEATATLENTHSPGLWMWASVFGALLVFAILVFLLCRKDGLKNKLGCCRSTSKSKSVKSDDDKSDEESSTDSVSFDPSKSSCPGVTFVAVLQDPEEVKMQHTMEY